MSDIVPSSAVNHIRLRSGRAFYTDEPYVLSKPMFRDTERITESDIVEISWIGPSSKEEREAIVSRDTVVLEEASPIERSRG